MKVASNDGWQNWNVCWGGSRWRSVFWPRPCVKSRNDASRRKALAEWHLRNDKRGDADARRRWIDDSRDVRVVASKPGQLLPELAEAGAETGRSGLARCHTTAGAEGSRSPAKCVCAVARPENRWPSSVVFAKAATAPACHFPAPRLLCVAVGATRRGPRANRVEAFPGVRTMASKILKSPIPDR